MNDKKRIEELVELLNNAAHEYYQNDNEIMSNKKYDELYDELVELENTTGIILENSPTQNVGSEISSSLPKMEHSIPMLSLNKTKNVSELERFLGDKEGILSWKLDGLTVVLTYENGRLTNALTRGDGHIGEVITNNARMFRNLPKSIPFKGKLVLRGEAVISYDNFYNINNKKLIDSVKNAIIKYIINIDNPLDINDVNRYMNDIIINNTEKLFSNESNFEIDSLLYKNPRNLCSGAVRQLNPRITYDRKVEFYAFSLVTADNLNFNNSHYKEFEFLSEQGFDVVYHKMVDKSNITDAVNWFSENINHNNIASDGLVLLYDDIEYGNKLGSTAKFPQNAIAFKWADNTKKTRLTDVLWNPSRTGLINPIAIFEPIELEGTTVQRASLHNLGIFESLQLGIGDEILVYKANMIIPQVDDNITRSNTIIHPSICPVCGSELEIRNSNISKDLYCPNDFCPAKLNKFLEHFISKNGMDISGLGGKILETFIDNEFINNINDIYLLPERRQEIIERFELDIDPKNRSEWAKALKFGIKKLDNVLNAINNSKITEQYKFIAALGIKDVGKSVARILIDKFNDINKIIDASVEELENIDGIGPVLANNIFEYFQNDKNKSSILDLLNILTFNDKEKKLSKINNLIFVITGKLENVSNRQELVDLIEANGGRVSSSVSKNTNFLINNDNKSNSSKNKKAKELNIPIITEKDFYEML